MKIVASGAPPSSPLKISNKLKKISYEPRRNFFQPQIVKNLLPKWSVFVRFFYKNNSISFFCLLPHSSSFGGVPDLRYSRMPIARLGPPIVHHLQITTRLPVCNKHYYYYYTLRTGSNAHTLGRTDDLRSRGQRKFAAKESVGSLLDDCSGRVH